MMRYVTFLKLLLLNVRNHEFLSFSLLQPPDVMAVFPEADLRLCINDN